MKFPERRQFTRYEAAPLVDVWMVDEGDVWSIHCMDCGTRIGTVNAGNESGSASLTIKHRKTLHG